MSDIRTLGLTDQERKLARHALGLNDRRATSYRNRFVAGPASSEHEVWRGLVRYGFAYADEDHTGRLDCFHLTLAGAKLAIHEWEFLDPEDFPQADDGRAV